MAKGKHDQPKTASFQTQGRLLQELGERLVARSDVALTELIKNSYDADATECKVEAVGDSLVVEDNGHGMFEQEFIGKWMEIATPEKQRERKSRRFRRDVTGSKGIGRFAVRFLGEKLKLETIARKGKRAEKLTIEFDWPYIDKQERLSSVKIPYRVETINASSATGTTLTISKLRNKEIQITKSMRTNLLAVINPYTGLDNGPYQAIGEQKGDPGFKVILPSVEDDHQDDLSQVVLKHAFSKLIIEKRRTYTQFTIISHDGEELLRERVNSPSKISSGFYADIRYFPRRAGMFSGIGVDGRTAWSWVRDDKNNGIGIVDHGFRIHPYGFGENDWLQLSYDAGHRKREWRSETMKSLYAIPEEGKSDSKLNPMLYLPGFHQLIGAVFVNSAADNPNDLTPSMDREGFVTNEAFIELRDTVRTGLELLAYVDHREQRKAEEKKRKAETKSLRKDLKSAVEFINTVPGLAKRDRQAVVNRFQDLSKELDSTQEYYRVGTQKLEMMGMLGVMAGFVTHEMQRVLHGLETIVNELKSFERKSPKIRSLREQVRHSISTIAGQLEYSTSFIGMVQDSQADPGVYYARGVSELVVEQFESFANERFIKVEIDIQKGVEAPRVPRALYNGVAMNLFTNALKAAIGGANASQTPKVTIKAWNEKGKHIFEVADTGVGIPPSIEKRIWDPLFTTTSASDYNPLGSGMGLGLSLVKKLLSEVGGTIKLVDPPPEYTTCFQVAYRR